MSTHELKTDSEVYELVVAGVKRYEIRFNDRDFNESDYLVLKETKFTGEEIKNGHPLVYTGRETIALITHVLDGYGLKDGWVILSIRCLS